MKKRVNGKAEEKHQWDITLSQAHPSIKNGFSQNVVKGDNGVVIFVDSFKYIDHLHMNALFCHNLENPAQHKVVKTLFEVKVQKPPIHLVFVHLVDSISCPIDTVVDFLVITSNKLGGRQSVLGEGHETQSFHSYNDLHISIEETNSPFITW